MRSLTAMAPLLIGYEEAYEMLTQQQREGRLPSVLLLSGSEQAPPLPLASALASALLCATPRQGWGCAACPVCDRVKRGVHPDVHYLFPSSGKGDGNYAQELLAWRSFLIECPYGSDTQWSRRSLGAGKRVQIGVGQVEQMAEFIEVSSLEGGNKVVLIWLPECLHPMAATKLLKPLEEPPARCYFLLVTHAPTSLLPTLSSRACRLVIPPFAAVTLTQVLSRLSPSLAAPRLAELVQIARGDLPRALDLLTPEKGEDAFSEIAHWLRRAYKRDWSALVGQAEQFEKLHKEEQERKVSAAFFLIRGAWLAQHGVADLLPGLEGERATFCHNLAKTLSCSQLEHLICSLEGMKVGLERNLHPKLLFLETSRELFGELF